MAASESRESRNISEDDLEAMPSHRVATSSPIDRVPPELIHMIFSDLEPIDVARLRTMSRVLAGIGIEYLVPFVWIDLNIASFARFLKVAHEPVISKYVRTVYYDCDLLPDLTRLEWERAIESPGYIASERAYTSNDAAAWHNVSIQKWRRFEARSMNWGRHNCCSYGGLDRAFVIFQRCRTEQDQLRGSDFLTGTLTEAFSRLPNLQMIQMIDRGTFDQYQAEIQTFLDASCNRSRFSPCSVEAARPILLAFGRAASKTQAGTTFGSASESLHQGKDNLLMRKPICLSRCWMAWELLKSGTAELSAIKAGLRLVNHLDLKFIHNCREMHQRLEEGAFHEFLKSAPDLEKFFLSRQKCEQCPTLDLSQIIGTYHWAALTTVVLGCISVTQNDLLQFCRRHQKTLKLLLLKDPRLDVEHEEEENWRFIFSQIRDILDLKMARMRGVFSEHSPWRRKHINMENKAPASDFSICDHVDLYLTKKQNPSVNFFVNTTTGKAEWHFDLEGETHQEIEAWEF